MNVRAHKHRDGDIRTRRQTQTYCEPAVTDADVFQSTGTNGYVLMSAVTGNVLLHAVTSDMAKALLTMSMPVTADLSCSLPCAECDSDTDVFTSDESYKPSTTDDDSSNSDAVSFLGADNHSEPCAPAFSVAEKHGNGHSQQCVSKGLITLVSLAHRVKGAYIGRDVLLVGPLVGWS